MHFKDMQMHSNTYPCLFTFINPLILRKYNINIYGFFYIIFCVCVCVQPFWPLGTGIARGFMASLDTAWMVRSWGKGVPPLQVLAERYRKTRLSVYHAHTHLWSNTPCTYCILFLYTHHPHAFCLLEMIRMLCAFVHVCQREHLQAPVSDQSREHQQELPQLQH